MKRTHTRRTLAAITALVFLLLGAGDLFGLRACPHHEVGAGAEHSVAHSPGDATGHGPHTGADQPSPEADHEPCNCAGFCPTVSGPGAPVIPEFSIPVVEVAAVEPVSDDTGVILAPVAYLLPFSQAPPTIR